MKKKISKEQRRREEQEKAMRVDLFLLLLLLPHLTIFVSYFYSQSEASVEH
jgi:hypothetical protein